MLGRARLLRDLLAELGDGGSINQLYAGLLARTLIGSDEELMRIFGEEVAERCDGISSHISA